MKKFGTSSSKKFFGKSKKSNPKNKTSSIYVSKHSTKEKTAAIPPQIVDSNVGS